MSRPSTPPNEASRLAKIEADLAELKTLTRKLREHRIRDHRDVNVQGAAAGDPFTYGGAAEGGHWGPGTVSGYKPMSVLIGDPTGGTPAGDGSNVIVPFTSLSSSTYNTPDIVPSTPAGSWTIPAGIYVVSAQVRWSTLGGVREIRLAGSAFPAFVPVELQVAAAAAEETVLAVSSGAFHAAVSGDVRVLARQTSGGAGTVFGEGLTIVRLAPYVFTP